MSYSSGAIHPRIPLFTICFRHTLQLYCATLLATIACRKIYNSFGNETYKAFIFHLRTLGHKKVTQKLLRVEVFSTIEDLFLFEKI